MTSTRTEREKRVNDVLSLRLNGARLKDVREHATAQGWGIGDRSLKRLMQAADKMLLQEAQEDRPKLIASHVAKRRMLFARAMKAQDFNLALKVIADEARLLGLYEPPAAANGHGPGPMLSLVAFLPQIRTALEAIGPPTSSGDFEPLARGDVASDIPDAPGPVQELAFNRQ